MLTRRNLGSRLILEKSSELRRNDKFGTKFKLEKKEDLKPVPAKHELHNRGIAKSLRSASLRNSNNKAIRNIENKKNITSKKNSLEKFSEKENISKSRCQKQSHLFKNKSLLKQNNFAKEDEPVKLSVKSKQNLKDMKECNKSNNRVKSGNQSFSDKCGSQQNELKISDTTEANLRYVSKVPIWKRELNLNKSNCRKKRNTLVDVYDIAQDEELIASEIEFQKKKICKPKKIKKKKILFTKYQNHKYMQTACEIVPSIEKRPTLEAEKTASNEMDIKLLVKENENNLFSVQNMTTEPQIKPKLVQNTNNILNSCLDEENTRQNPVLREFVQASDGNEIFEESDFDSTQSEFQSNKLLLDLADELEKSFMIPKMTSTPDGVQVQKAGVLNVANITTTTHKDYLNMTVATPNEPVCKNILQKDEGKENVGDITLFESPAKKKKKDKEIQWKFPKKSIQINLFGEFVNSPNNEQNFEELVLKPRKSYDTPDNFKIHIVRTKRNDVCKKEIKKSKEELLIEKMTKHFKEVGDTELCIE